MQLLASMPAEQRSQMAAQMGMTPEQLQQVASMMASMPPEAMQQLMGAAMQGMGGMGGMPGMGGGMPGGGAPPGQVAISLTPEEAASVDQLVSMGFSKGEAVQAFLACDKNAEMAANLLFENGGFGGGGDAAPAPGGGGGGDASQGGGGGDASEGGGAAQ